MNQDDFALGAEPVAWHGDRIVAQEEPVLPWGSAMGLCRGSSQLTETESISSAQCQARCQTSGDKLEGYLTTKHVSNLTRGRGVGLGDFFSAGQLVSAVAPEWDARSSLTVLGEQAMLRLLPPAALALCLLPAASAGAIASASTYLHRAACSSRHRQSSLN